MSGHTVSKVAGTSSIKGLCTAQIQCTAQSWTMHAHQYEMDWQGMMQLGMLMHAAISAE